MIKNIIFDLGNVLISFKPSEFLDSKNYPEKTKALILSDIFGSPEWQLLDSGDLNVDKAIEGIMKNSLLERDEIRRIFDLRQEILFPIDSNVKLLPELKKQGFRLYFLSNFPIDIWEEVKNGYSLFEYFDGGMISAEVRVSKPDSRIYGILMEKYSLKPEECLYIDDLEPNVIAAEATGMKGIVTYGSLEISQKIQEALAIAGN